MNEFMQDLLKLQSLEFSDSRNEDTAAKIVELRGRISPQIIGHYDRLRARGKKGVAAVQNQVCTGCHMRLPLGVIMTLKRGPDIQLCDNCGRYLYLSDQPEAAADAQTPSVPVSAPRRRKKSIPPIEPVVAGSNLTPPPPSRPRINPG